MYVGQTHYFDESIIFPSAQLIAASHFVTSVVHVVQSVGQGTQVLAVLNLKPLAQAVHSVEISVVQVLQLAAKHFLHCPSELITYLSLHAVHTLLVESYTLQLRIGFIAPNKNYKFMKNTSSSCLKIIIICTFITS